MLQHSFLFIHLVDFSFSSSSCFSIYINCLWLLWPGSFFGQFISKLQKTKMLRYFLQIHSLLYWEQVFLLQGYVQLFIMIPCCSLKWSLVELPITGWTLYGFGSFLGWSSPSRDRIFLASWIRYCSLSWPSVGPLFHDSMYSIRLLCPISSWFCYIKQVNQVESQCTTHFSMRQYYIYAFQSILSCWLFRQQWCWAKSTLPLCYEVTLCFYISLLYIHYIFAYK